LAAAHSLTDRAEDMSAHMQWLGDILLQADEWRDAQTPDTLIQELAARLRREADPVRTCIQLFEDLEPDRRRGEFERSAGERDCTLPSLILLFVLGVLVATGAECDVVCTVRYLIERAMRLKLTSASVTPPRVQPRDVLGMGLAAACERLGPDDLRTSELLDRVSGHDDVLAMLLLRLEEPLRASLIAAIRMSRDEVIRRIEDWGTEAGSADAATISIAVVQALRTAAAPVAAPVADVVRGRGSPS
jgi:hypothetical protein